MSLHSSHSSQAQNSDSLALARAQYATERERSFDQYPHASQQFPNHHRPIPPYPMLMSQLSPSSHAALAYENARNELRGRGEYDDLDGRRAARVAVLAMRERTAQHAQELTDALAYAGAQLNAGEHCDPEAQPRVHAAFARYAASAEFCNPKRPTTTTTMDEYLRAHHHYAAPERE
jgi:hypothetical protein